MRDPTVKRGRQATAGRAVDLHQDLILGTLVRLALPIFLGMIFQILYGIVDTFWISRIDPSDPSYVGGVGMILPLFFLVIALGSGILIGMSSLVARASGAKDRHTLERAFGSGLLIGGTLASLLVALGYLFDSQIIGALGARDDYYVHALEYLRFIIPAGALMLVGNVFNGIIMGEGLMKQIMVAAIIATMANSGLDPLFIFTLGMGVRGAALATVTSQLIAAVYILRLFMRGRTTTPVRWEWGSIGAGIVKRIAAIGFPQAAGQLSLSLSFFVFNRILIGTDPRAVTAFAICARFDQILFMPLLAIGTAVITMVGQSFGAGHYRRIHRTWRVALTAALGGVGLLAATFMSVAPKVYPLFSDVHEVVDYAVRQTRIVMPSFLMVAVVVLGRTTFQGIGRALPGLVGNLLRSIGIAVPAALLFTYVLDMGIPGVWLGMVTGNTITAGVVFLWTVKALRSLQERGTPAFNQGKAL